MAGMKRRFQFGMRTIFWAPVVVGVLALLGPALVEIGCIYWGELQNWMEKRAAREREREFIESAYGDGAYRPD